MEAARLRLNEETLTRLQTACDEFHSTLLQLETDKLRIPGDSDNLSPDEGVSISGDEPLGKGDFTSHSLLNTPPDLCKRFPMSHSLQSGHTQLPLPAPVLLGECFSCGKTCGRTLTCGHHTCSEACHSGECKRCALDPSLCLACPCGRVVLSKLVSVSLYYWTPNEITINNRKVFWHFVSPPPVFILRIHVFFFSFSSSKFNQRLVEPSIWNRSKLKSAFVLGFWQNKCLFFRMIDHYKPWKWCLDTAIDGCLQWSTHGRRWPKG